MLRFVALVATTLPLAFGAGIAFALFAPSLDIPTTTVGMTCFGSILGGLMMGALFYGPFDGSRPKDALN